KQDELHTLNNRPTLPRVHFPVQEEPRGFGDAIAHGEPMLTSGRPDGSPFNGAVIALGDDIVHAKIGAMRQLISAHAANGNMIVGVQRVSREQATRYGVVVVEPSPLDLGDGFVGKTAYRVSGMEEKPANPTPNRINGEEVYLAVVGRYLINATDMAYLSGSEGSIYKELDFTSLLQMNARDGNLTAVELDGVWHSVGTPLESQKAFIRFALQPESGEPTTQQQELRAFTRQLLDSID
ncbi:MAG: sugar phosphate nucleotidyltransferase, partial [Candidatus Poribacteria bacterium]|nr:sugar phosphate nucleotidyltransferase [Candidatus Poribacteria bacterium]